MDYAIRAMEFEDYDSVISLWRRTEEIVLTDTDEKEAIQIFLSRNPGLSLVAYCDGELAGAALCSQDGRRGYIHHLATGKRFRRHGIGSALVRESLLRLSRVGIRKCNIFILPENREGIALWQRNGFRMLQHFDWMQAVIEANG